MTPQTKQTLDVLKKDQGITIMTAMHYGITNLSARLSDLKDAGFEVVREQKKDLRGQKYSRWYLTEHAPA